MEKKTVTIKGQVYTLPPFNNGQMRHGVDPLLLQTREVQKRAKAVEQSGTPDMDAMLELSILGREIQQKQANLALEGLRNAYPKLTMEDLDELTPNQLSTIFNEILVVTQNGSNEPGEGMPQRKRSR